MEQVFTPEGCQEISQGSRERSERDPWLTGSQHVCRLKVCKRFPGVRKKRVPLANVLAPLRGALLILLFATSTHAQDLSLDRVVTMYIERNLELQAAQYRL